MTKKKKKDELRIERRTDNEARKSANTRQRPPHGSSDSRLPVLLQADDPPAHQRRKTESQPDRQREEFALAHYVCEHRKDDGIETQPVAQRLEVQS